MKAVVPEAVVCRIPFTLTIFLANGIKLVVFVEPEVVVKTNCCLLPNDALFGAKVRVIPCPSLTA